MAKRLHGLWTITVATALTLAAVLVAPGAQAISIKANRISSDFGDTTVEVEGSSESPRWNTPARESRTPPKAKARGKARSAAPSRTWSRMDCNLNAAILTITGASQLAPICGLLNKAVCNPQDKYLAYGDGTKTGLSNTTACIGGNTPQNNSTSAAAAAPPRPTITQHDFATLKIPAAQLHTQLNGFSLRNAHTNVYANSNTQTLHTTILNQPVTIRATPTNYTFNYGDGNTLTTTNPGKPTTGDGLTTQTPTSHIYTQTGHYTITLTTTYRGEYSINNGPYQPIPGTATIPSTPLTIAIYKTRQLNVK